jgi:hypothetical protein
LLKNTISYEEKEGKFMPPPMRIFPLTCSAPNFTWIAIHILPGGLVDRDHQGEWGESRDIHPTVKHHSASSS